ncbi:MAG TPA: flippase activity-associated protein Agl23 [Chloroflexota bacterium]|nr:flippase activity-associated protein Agl23 [Chloroflexota bacterium]
MEEAAEVTAAVAPDEEGDGAWRADETDELHRVDGANGAETRQEVVAEPAGSHQDAPAAPRARARGAARRRNGQAAAGAESGAAGPEVADHPAPAPATDGGSGDIPAAAAAVGTGAPLPETREAPPREEPAAPRPELAEVGLRAQDSAPQPETRDAAQGEPNIREWLSRRWLFGLSYWQAIALGGLFVALILTRFSNLGERAMHHDESMHARYAWETYHGQIYKYWPLLHGPFQFLAVAGSFWLFGSTEWTARAVPAAFGVALVGLTFLWRRWLGTAGWLLAAAIFTFSPSFIYFSRMLREDSYTATWTLLAATGLVGYVLQRRRAWYYAFCAGLAFAFATKESTYITAFIFGTFMILCLLWEPASTRWRRILAGAATGAILGAFWSSVMGNFKQELHEVGGAVLGLLLGMAAGFAYDLARGPAPVAGRGPALLGRSPGRRGPAPAAPLAPPEQGSRVAQDGRVEQQGGRAAGTTGAAGAAGFTGALRALWQDVDGFWGVGTFWGGVVIFFVIFIVLFSSLFTNIAGVREGLIGSITYWLEQHGVQRGNQPWYYYVLILGVYETLAFAFTLVATVYYLRRPTWLTTFLIWWWVLALVIYSWAGEKMPWLVIHIATPMVLLSARYVGELLTAATSATRWRWERRLALGALPVLALWTIHTGWPVNFERPDTPRDLLVYTQTAPDVKKVMADIERLSLEQTGDARGLGVVVTRGPSWPFSWYLRDFKNAEYPSQLAAPPTKPVVLVAAEDDELNRPFLQGYVRTKYKMRWWYPEDYRTIPDEMRRSGGLFGYLARKDVRDGMWNWLLYRETTQPIGSYDFYVYVKEGLGPGTAVNASTVAGAQPVLPGQQVGQSGQAGQGVAAPQLNLEQYAQRTVAVNPIAQWGSSGRNPGQFNVPRGVALDAQGNVYVADTLNHRIQKFDPSGTPITAWGSEGNGDGQFKEPMGVAVDGQGFVYVADTWNHRIQKFDANGRFVTKWAGQGGSFWGPRAIAVDGQGFVYVTDTGNKRIQKFDANGRFVSQLGGPGAGAGQLNEPIGLAVTPAGEVYVADTNNRRIQKFDAGGQAVAAWPVAGWPPGVRNEPYLALDAEGNLYATDPLGARIVKFSPQGEVLAVGGTPGRGAGQFELPLGIAAGGAGGAIYVADSGNGRIQVLAAL